MRERERECVREERRGTMLVIPAAYTQNGT
jgi:hypothetical protein